MNKRTKISALGAVAVTVLAVGSLATFAAPGRTGAPAAGVGREADDSPPLNLNNGHLGNPAQVSHARQQAMSMAVGDQESWQFVAPTSGTLYAGTDFGAFYLADGKNNWARLGTGLPNAPVFDLKLTGDRSTIYAATFGRGIYKIPAPQG